jgi:hypothetical protein
MALLVKVIFAFGTVATLAALFLKYRKDRDRRLLILGSVGVVASVARFALTSIDLARFKAPLAISAEQQKRISAKMKEFAGQEYAGWVAPGVGDAWELWEEIAFSLDAAGWKFFCCISGRDLSTSSSKPSPRRSQSRPAASRNANSMP